MRANRSAAGRAAIALAFTLPLLVGGAVAQDCLDCHDVDAEAFADTPHGFADCTDCHDGAADLPHDDLDAIEVDCSMCHDEVVARYRESIHGIDHDNGNTDVPYCQTCHGTVHSLLPASDPRSPVHPDRLARTCGTCHADPDVVAKFGIPVARPLEAYEASVHSRRLGEGGPTCNDCHDNHSIFGAQDPRSTVFHQTVPETCGACHGEIRDAYQRSVHGSAASHGAREAPVCTDCHGEHRILSPNEPGSPVFATNVPKMTCGRCHSDLRLADKFGIASDKVPAYEDSYHGLASRSGRVTVAHCGSCHGVHDILPSSDPRSHTNTANLPVTCGQCHPGAGTRFAIGTIHVVNTERAQAGVYWVRVIYLWLIWLTIGGMVLHNLLDLLRKVRNPRVEIPPGPGPERLSRGFRTAHALLVTSFAVLVYTGFALTYPEAWWARPIVAFDNGNNLRGWLHRGAAIVLFGAMLFHVVHLIVDRAARRCIADMRPTVGDWNEFRERVRWFFGRRPHPPLAGNLGYPEKMEYLALVWGLVIMSITGLLLWFDDTLLRWLPKWVADIATVIHFYEAVLATLAILVWHLYFVIFDPLVYPIDPAWWSGRSHPGRALERAHPGSHPKPQPGSSGPRKPAEKKTRHPPAARSGAMGG